MRQVKYLGQILDAQGIRPDPDKIAPIVSMPPPHDIPKLRSYLGAINYYGKYVQEMRTLRQPMDQLLKAGMKFHWSTACQRSFDRFREILQSPLLLTQYNPKMEIIVSADASNVGLGARIAHKFPDGSIKAIYHVSRSLTSAESNYSQIEKEALALIFAVTRFHRIIYGRRFILETDHKPLLAIFGAKKGIPTYTANRLQRWALTLLLYDFSINYISTDSFGHADDISRLINRHVRPDEEMVIANLTFEKSIRSILNESLQAVPLSFKTIQNTTKNDDTLQQIIKFIKEGWPPKTIINDPKILQFYQRRDGLSVVADCITYGERLVVPPSSRESVLKQLHKGHPGIERMRSIARQYVYWPNVDEDVAHIVKSCIECSSVAKTDRKTTLESWPVPEKAWQRLHLDYAGPVNGYYYLILVDAYSKWPEVMRTKDITTTATLRMLRNIFARHGQPETLVTDNGTQFTSNMFETFCEHLIVHLKTAPFHPQSNGLAERFVDTFKRALKNITAGGETLEEAIDTFLLCYRSTPCRSSPEGKSPAEHIYKRPIRTALELLRPPSSSHKVHDNKQEKQFNLKHGAKKRHYSPQDLVWAKVYHNNKWSWAHGQVIGQIGSVLYNVWLSSTRKLIRSHCNQLRSRHEAEVSQQEQLAITDVQIPLAILLDNCGLNEEVETTTSTTLPSEMLADLAPPRQRSRVGSTRNNNQPPVPTRQSSRQRVPPTRYDAYHLY
ncbi:uncharacterized protein K02A2.6-like isoform X1 [Anopheles arabiensis]|uniref:uncharacterized protein K02A2.6-like isoform X1 n=1 Tax=Anopheles arabiensis TaxID=7173 RepID=UPI001AAC6D7F|nr:uncharacterized protein K02A2.6-like isoform X1 [Anopheles arabiensis]